MAELIEPVESVLTDCREYWDGVRTGPIVTFITAPTYRQMGDGVTLDLDAMAGAAAECLRTDLHARDPYVPPAVCADFGTISTARLYGGRILPAREGGKVHIEPAIRNLGDLERLTPCPFEESDFQHAITLWRRVCDRVGTDRIFLRTPDFQGPLNTLALVMDQETMLAGFYDAPELLRHALFSITATLIEYHQRLRAELGGGRVIGNIWPYTTLPEDLGASLTEDLWPLLGADLYAEFGIPCLRKIAEAFGGVQIHCCGRYAHHLPALKESGIRIRGLEFHHPFTTFAELYRIFGDDIVYIPYLFGECKDYPDYPAFAESLLRQGGLRTRFWFAMAEGWCEEAALRRLVEIDEGPLRRDSSDERDETTKGISC